MLDHLERIREAQERRAFLSVAGFIGGITGWVIVLFVVLDAVFA